MLQRHGIGTRLGIGFGALLLASTLAFLAAAAIGVQGQRLIHEVGESANQRIALVQSMRESQLLLVSAIRSAGLQTDGAALNREVDAYRTALKALVKGESEFAALPTTEEERGLLNEASRLRKQAEPLVDEAIKFTMAFAGDEASKVLTERFAPIERQWADQLSKLTQLQTAQATAAKDSITRDNHQRVIWLGVLLALVVVGGSLFALTTTRSVTRPLREAAAVAARVAEGDLTVHIETSGNDEAADLLRSLGSMARQLASMVAAVGESAESIELASREITQGNLDLSARTESQASSVQQTSATLHELTGMVNQTADNARAVRALTDHTAGIAEQGGTAMTSVAQTMERISESSRRIGDIIGVIDGIAFQTNILALNAAVEAARAGEQGRGFAVVASEVRALAGRVSHAASEVRALIGESVERVDDGGRQVGGMNKTMTDLLSSVERVRTLVAEITAASTSQSESIAQVNEAVQTIDSSTQQNSALVEQVAAAAQSLSGQTARLTGLVRRFRVAHSA
jgi:methyl-accepting chemotaxis protein